jgi:hypothetical protein
MLALERTCPTPVETVKTQGFEGLVTKHRAKRFEPVQWHRRAMAAFFRKFPGNLFALKRVFTVDT